MAHEEYQSCIQACYVCADACDHCASACLADSNASEMARCIQLDIDCAQICRLAAGYMARGSELAGVICGACADICQACAEECAQHDMQHCQACAEACRRCAEECRRVASQRPGARQSQNTGVPAH